MMSLLGRSDVLARLDSLLADPGGVGFAVVVAEAGLGKTRLLDEFRRAVESRVGQAITITFPDHGLDPLEPLRGLVRELGQGWNADDQTLSPDERRWELSSLLVDAAATAGRVLVTVDDLHKAHVDALWVLDRVIASSGDLVVVGATRPDARGVAVNLQRRAMVVPLAPLARDDVAALLAAASSHPQRAGVDLTADDVMAVSGGNPLLVNVVLRSGDPTARGRSILRSRVEELPPVARAVVEVMAVAGDAPAGVVAEAAGRTGPDFVAAVEAAERAGVLDSRRFSHDLLRDAVLEGLGPADRHRLHLAVAAAWESVPSTDARIERLRHLLAAIPTSTPASPTASRRTAAEHTAAVIEEVLALARALVDARQPERGVDLLETARAIVTDHLPGDVELHAAVLVALADARFELGDVHPSVALGRQASELLDAAGSRAVEVRARAAVAATRLHDTIEPEPLSAHWVAEALAALPSDDGALRARLLGRAAVLAVTALDFDRAHALADDGLAMAQRLHDPELEIQLLTDRYLCVGDRDDAAARERLGARVIGLAAVAGRSALARDGHQWIASGCVARGDLRGASEELDRFALRALVRPDPRWQVAVDFRRMAILGMTGPRVSALEFAVATWERFEDQLGEVERAGVEFEYRSSLVRLYGFEDPAIEPLHGLLFDRPVPPVPFVSIRAGVPALLAGDTDGMRPVVDRWAPRAADVVRSFMGLPTAAILAAMTAAVGDSRHCASVVAALAPFAGLLPTDNGIGVNPPVDTLVARNLVHLDRLDAAARSARAGVALVEDSGAAPLHAAALGVLLEVERRRGVDTASLEARARDAAGVGGVHLPALDGDGRAVADGRGSMAPGGVVPGGVVSGRMVPGGMVAGGTVAGGTVAGRTVRGRMVRDGAVWLIDSPWGSVTVDHTLGTEQLSRVLAAGGTEVAAVDLAGGFGATVVAADLGPVLDATAKRAYRRRIVDLEAEVEEADRFNDVARAERARVELEQVMEELRRAVGLGGRDRPHGSGHERARVNVTRSIRRAIKAIAAEAPDLGGHLDVAILTGRFCSYRPDPNAAVAWEVER